MAYFPNGTAGMHYEETYCNHCVHQKIDDGGCAVWLLHMLHNYDVDNERTKPVLDLLIPMKPDGLEAAQCAMFHPADENRCRLTGDMFEAGA